MYGYIVVFAIIALDLEPGVVYKSGIFGYSLRVDFFRASRAYDPQQVSDFVSLDSQLVVSRRIIVDIVVDAAVDVDHGLQLAELGSANELDIAGLVWTSLHLAGYRSDQVLSKLSDVVHHRLEFSSLRESLQLALGNVNRDGPKLLDA